MKQTLSLRPAGSAPASATRSKRAISASRLDRIHDLAREQRRYPSEAETVLAAALAEAFPTLLFKRKAVAGSVIADFQCRQRPLVLMLTSDSANADPALADRADRQLAEQKLTVLRFDPEAVVADVAAVIEQVRAAVTALTRPPRPVRAPRAFARPQRR
ncbi:DUF559 domain-containing protein [Novosphingobium olei]|uniref:DUF559 domain-containing protein n=1 Tax=Novosphingobium olei TaxID=2728851 RepID=A0A7Y0GCN4_9SPHN|nr:DUF559 domain-containing protein [Novosphingobium olei]NML95782.1 DUF559 domain-containing protein [Novosphingobium olei]